MAGRRGCTLNAAPYGPAQPSPPAFWYSPTLRSKKLVLPCRLIISIQSNGLADPYMRSYPRATSRRSATNSMY